MSDGDGKKEFLTIVAGVVLAMVIALAWQIYRGNFTDFQLFKDQKQEKSVEEDIEDWDKALEVKGNCNEDEDETDCIDEEDVEDWSRSQTPQKTEIPFVHHLIEGKWVIYIDGREYPERFIEIKGNAYRENLGDDILLGNKPKVDDYIHDVREGSFEIVANEYEFQGTLKLQNRFTVNFTYMEQINAEPHLQLMPNVYLSREDWHEDYRSNPEYEYPTKIPDQN